MASTKITTAQIATGYVSSSLGNTPTLSPSGGVTVVYSANNNSVTLSPGTYILTAGASGRVAMASQDSSFGVDIYNGASNVASNVLNSLNSTGNIIAWPNLTCQTTVTITAQKTFTVRIEQTYGTGSSYSGLSTWITFTKTG